LGLAEEALAMATTSLERGRASLQIAMTAGAIGDPRSGPAAQEAARLLRGRRHRVDYGNLLANLGVDAFRAGRWREAQSLFTRAGLAFEDGGDSTGMALIANNMAEMLFEQGHLTRAQEQLAHARRVFAAAGNLFYVALCEVLEGSIAARAGDLNQAERLLEESRKALVRLGAEEYVLDADIRMVEVLLWRGLGDDAHRRAVECERQAVRLDQSGMYARWAGRLRAWALCSLGRSEDAVVLTKRLVEKAREMDDQVELMRCLLTLETIAERVGAPVGREVIEERDRLVERLDFPRLPALPLGTSSAGPNRDGR
jgi:tetratricopeptide (TPR) repeat protein